MDAIDKLLTKGVDTIYPSRKALEKKLIAGDKIRLYHGVDPTGTKLHLGHSIGLSKLQEFADLGHDVRLLFGTGTVLAGDPSQRSSARKKITQEEIDKNISSWKDQVSSIIDFNNVKIVQNGDWLLKLGLKDIIEIASHISAVQLFKRDSFTKRIEKGDTVWAHETLYPLLQGYDSVAMDVDLEIGGTDQMFNMLIGRELQQKMNNREKFVITTKMIVGTDGAQMSKSTGNCVWLNDTPNDMFGKLMSMPDDIMPTYTELLTNLDYKTLKKECKEPIDQKKKLARTIISRFHGKKQAIQAQEHFEKTVQQGDTPEDIPVLSIAEGSMTLSDLLVESGLASSKSEAKRLSTQGGVEINGKKYQNPSETIAITDNMVLRAGKRKFVKITI